VNIKSVYFFFIFSIFIVGCELFTTRTPEDPNTSSLNYPPATSYEILLNNFSNSINELSSENYYNCFLSDDEVESISYTFFPSPDAVARYGIVFENWTSFSEKNFLLGLKSKVESGIMPSFKWTSGNFEIMTLDSTVYVGQYELSMNLQKELETFSGISRMTFIHNSSGLWKIKTWQDFQLNSSDSAKTFSILKGQIAN